MRSEEALLRRIETLQAERVAACSELARLRGVPLGELVEQLGLGPSHPSAEERPTAGGHGFRHLGRTLRILRGLAEIPQTELARRAQCGVSQVSRVESGQANPRVETLGRLLAALDVTPLGLGFALAAVDNLLLPANLPRRPADLARRIPAVLQVFGREEEGELARQFADLTASYLNLVTSLHSVHEGRIAVEAEALYGDRGDRVGPAPGAAKPSPRSS
jgi:transcriptional regulator with XRE-family HTH domain